MRILVTGGAGFIGSHTCVELLQGGHEVIVLDNLYNSAVTALRRVEKITGRSLTFCKGDVRDGALLKTIFARHAVDVVIHFAALKAVGESVQKPLEYYDNNIGGVVTLCKAMREAGVHSIIFSSSATVYGVPETVPVKEDFPLSATSPYGRTKLMTEEILRDVFVADNRFSVVLLRYFNPIGAHESGLIGEYPKGIPNNLTPYIAQVATGKLKELKVFGNDYPTPDGTGVRDYIHVVDLAKGHVCALKKASEPGVHIYNLGTGVGYSVLQVIAAFEKACGKTIPYVFAPRRAGDVAENYADPSKALRELGWKTTKGIDDMCRDLWNWQSKNPDGYPVEDKTGTE
ncbi:UDP-glucose 4-epimerase GalE [Ethanoligenens harbinense]|uniref:UDP-glucose 4-epimerase n=1 Tax=Ethanoligenens harbinense (strain DSM 18485 / JCM 12961 / CGMCC 1.5033 / YUAN-3) TaxID=663278 RepID=E6U2W2_ETHHY|nr:UDP-glucose 4-epimerase GalE [Ethanoligenens harbinense]ADU26329.1 UDP-glucose 4-epimerase [Ethanoligenens harbinense YUAN-3]AVQ95463.1 UDP-glucose 4-epimerase GalE [Ethanoligenens harbinense YUAN-3]AYF38127.1 UDP-glucose 4-epimerase GalE [Ethanoligenens harbinense]AYF40873.1 UDP-glucose 4-epimerase GalE [Ethanoligenens harbinense]QCN91703.1 UDP-glucose 4-epimerase GalE [Ethanoligenens harbinense]